MTAAGERRTREGRQRKAELLCRRLLAAALSLIVPGAGQLLLGYRRRRLVMLTVTALLGLRARPSGGGG